MNSSNTAFLLQDGSAEGRVQLDSCHLLYGPCLCWSFLSLSVTPSKFAFLYPAFFSVSCSSLSISSLELAIALGCRSSSYAQVLCTWFTAPCLLVLSEGPSLPVKSLYLVAPAPIQPSKDAPVWWAYFLWQQVSYIFLIVNFPN